MLIHGRAVHEGVKYSCGKCVYQSSSKAYIAQRKSALHEGLKNPCRQCGYQTTAKGSLAKHKRALHEGVKFFIIGSPYIC